MSEQLCNLMLEETDLKKLQDLDPFQTDGYQSNCKLNIPVKIVYIDETGKQTTDTQIITFQMLTRWVRTVSKNKQAANLDSLKIVITSEDDVFLAFVNNINQSGFQTLKNKNQLNLHFNDFPSTLITMLKNCISSNEFNQINQAELRLSYEGTGKFYIFQNTQYKKIQLIELFFSSCNIEKSHQSIIYRYNYNKTKLRMLQNSIQSVYKLLAQKNVPLLHYIQKHVGMDQ